MKRLFLALFVLGLFTMTVPRLRERALPKVTAALRWTGSKLEGPLSPVIDPYRKLMTKSQMTKALGRLNVQRNRGMPRPDEDDVTDFLIKQKVSKNGMDPWGQPYLLEHTRDSVYVMSSGADRTFGTADDLRDGVHFPGRPLVRRRPRR